MGLIAPADSMFLLGESREHPMHVAGLHLYELPPGAGESYVSELYAEMLQHTDVRPELRKRPADPVSSLGQTWWSTDENVDIEHHVRLSALPRPGRVKELLALVSRLHGTLLDRHRPLWEFHLIDGLEGGRFATYFKVHHALVDGVSATRMFAMAMSDDPQAEVLPVWAARPAVPGKRARKPGKSSGGPLDMLKELAGTVPALARLVDTTLRGGAGAPAAPAPRTMLNVPITGARRFAGQSWPIDRLKSVGADAGATLNDVVLAMCAGALRRYLLEQDGLPDKPLVGGVPVSLHAKGGGRDGNAVGAVLCDLATEVADPAERLRRISESMRVAKKSMAGRTPLQIQLMSAALLGLPTALATLPGGANVVPPMFNLIISNVPGPRRPLYFNGARLTGMYPVSIPGEGMALNITVLSYAGSMEFGLTGCRQKVPHLQRLLGYLEDSIAELET